MAALLLSPAARADGPHIAFHATQGACTVTLFSAPDPLVAGPAELTLLVQNAADGSLAATPSATGQAALPGHAPVPFRFAPGGAKSRLLTATVPLPAPGAYALTLQVNRQVNQAASSGGVTFHGSLPVEPNHGRRDIVLWAVILPAVLAWLFLTNQSAKLRLRRARPKAQPVTPPLPRNR